MDFGFLNPVNWAKATGGFIEKDPAAFQILTGNLGSLLGGQNPFLQGLGKFGAGLGYTSKLDEQAQKQHDWWKEILGMITGPSSPGVTGIKANDKGGYTVDLTGENGMTPFNKETSPLGPDFNMATGVQAPSGGGATPSPFQLAGGTSSTPQGSKTSLDALSALFNAYSQPQPSMKWLTPEMAIQVMGQRQNERQLANQFATTLRAQDLTRQTAIEKALLDKTGKIPVKISPTGEMQRIRPGEEPDTWVTGSEYSSAQRDVSQYGITTEENREQKLRNQVARFLGASDFAGLQPDSQDVAVEITRKAQKYWDDRKIHGYASIDEAIKDAFYEIKNTRDILTTMPEAEREFKLFGGEAPIKSELINEAVSYTVAAINAGASAQMVETALRRKGYDVEQIIGLAKAKLGVK